MPQLQTMIEHGVVATAGYSASPQCSPSRAALLTGKYPIKTGLNEIIELPLDTNQRTFPQHLKELGYMTGMVGKWHLSPRKKSTKWQEANGYKQWKDVPEKIIANYYPQNFGFREYATGAFHKYYSNFDIKGNKVSPVKIALFFPFSSESK